MRSQVVRHVAANLTGVAGRETMTLQLNPEHLGQVEISLSGRDDQLTVVIQASGKEAEQAIREGLSSVAGLMRSGALRAECAG